MPERTIAAALGEWWHMLVAAGAIIASHVRLQAQANQNRQDIDKLEGRLNKQREEDQARTAKALEGIDKKLDRLLDHILDR